MPVTAVHLINTDVRPTFEQHKAQVTTILSDNGRKFCGRPDSRHPYELLLQLEEIEHRTTRVKRPQSNGFVERLHRTLLAEHFRVQGRKKRSEEHTSELQSLMRISYAVFCLKKKKLTINTLSHDTYTHKNNNEE